MFIKKCKVSSYFLLGHHGSHKMKGQCDENKWDFNQDALLKEPTLHRQRDTRAQISTSKTSVFMTAVIISLPENKRAQLKVKLPCFCLTSDTDLSTFIRASFSLKIKVLHLHSVSLI